MSFKNLFYLIAFLPLFSLAQNTNETLEKQALSEAQAMDITTQQQALDALKKKGIDENQARQMAKMRGIDFDQFLKANFKFVGDTSIKTPSNNKIIDTGFKVNATPIQVGNIQENSVIIQNKIQSNRYFGYDIFLNNPFAQKEYLVGNIDEGYIIAPGDILRILVFGDNSMQIEVKVDNNGNISIPNFGVFMASGNSFATLRNRLKIYLGKYFSGILSSPQRTFLDVSLTQIRPTSITVLGDAVTPGPHLVSGFATVLNALYAAGGIKTNGSLRSIKVYRNNQLLKEVDLYDYITSGKLDNDVRLSNNDIIFISPRLSEITLNGSVKKPFIYELKKSEGLNELLKYSGGLLPTASISDVTIKRITSFENRDQKKVYDRFLTSINYQQLIKSNKNFSLENGDEISFNSILDKVLNNVKVAGNVNMPGTYSLEKYNDLKSVIKILAKDLKQNTYLGKVDIFKEDIKGNKSFKTYNLEEVLNDKTLVKLENDDEVQVYSLNEIAGEKLIKISGFTNEPKTIFWRNNISLYDLIFQSTSLDELVFKSKILTSRVDLKRFNIKTGLFDIIKYNLDDLISLKNIFLEPKDEIILYSKDVYMITNKKVNIDGYINTPGQITLKNNMQIEDVILDAGGFKEYADQEVAIVNRERFDATSGKLSERFEVPIDIDYLKGIRKETTNPFVLQNNDIVFIRKLKGVEIRNSVQVEGEVYYPMTVTLENEVNTLSQIINSAGGLKKTANLDASYIIRNNKVLTINLNNFLNSDQKILENGDRIFIASDRGTILTLGAVHNENQFIWQKGRKAKFYIKLSGGKIRKESEDSYVVLPNGKTKKINWLHNPTLLPNSKIVVNRKIIEKDKSNDKSYDNFLKFLTIITSSLTAAVLASKL